MLKILSSFVIPFLLAGSLNNISPKRQNEETGLNYKSIIAEKDFSFKDDVVNDPVRQIHYDQLFDFKNSNACSLVSVYLCLAQHNILSCSCC